MKLSIFSSTIAAAVLHFIPASVQAFPNGAGGVCPAGQFGVGGAHLLESRNPMQPSFAQAGLQLTIDGQVVGPNTVIPSDTDVTIAVEGTGSTTFRGSLIRVEQGADSSVFTLMPEANSQIANVCVSVATAEGVTHTDNMPKTILSAVFQTSNTMDDVTIDVTVVTANNAADGSVFSFQQFVVSVAAPTGSPVAAATNNPVAAPTGSPIVSPTASPVAAPTSSPVAAPTSMSPVAGPTGSPIVSPTASPVASPTGKPKFCFSEMDTVQVENRNSPVAMRDLKVGDKVLTGIDDTYEAIYAFGHRHVTEPATFLQLYTDHSKTATPLEITGEHMIYVQGKQGAVRADTVKVGDILSYLLPSSSTPASEAFHPAAVTRVGQVEREGVYAPLTSSGKLIVNGIETSAYAGVLGDASEYVEIGSRRSGERTTIPFLLQEEVIHSVMSPLRMVCRGVSSKLCSGLNGDGVLNYVAVGMKLLEWGEEQHVSIQVVALGIALLVSRTFAAMELLFMTPSGGLVCLFMACVLIVMKYLKKVNEPSTLKKLE